MQLVNTKSGQEMRSGPPATKAEHLECDPTTLGDTEIDDAGLEFLELVREWERSQKLWKAHTA